MSETAPAKIRVAQDAEGFWTCREAISGSQQYVREDIVSDLLAAAKWAESAIAPFSKEPAERSGISRLRAAIAKAGA